MKTSTLNTSGASLVAKTGVVVVVVRGLCQGLVSSDIDTPRLGKNSAERAQTSRTPMSSYRDYASRRPQEPWKYLDIYFAPPLVCSAIQCIIFAVGRDTFSSGQRKNLKRFVFGSFPFGAFFEPLGGSRPRQSPRLVFTGRGGGRV